MQIASDLVGLSRTPVGCNRTTNGRATVGEVIEFLNSQPEPLEKLTYGTTGGLIALIAGAFITTYGFVKDKVLASILGCVIGAVGVFIACCSKAPSAYQNEKEVSIVKNLLSTENHLRSFSPPLPEEVPYEINPLKEIAIKKTIELALDEEQPEQERFDAILSLSSASNKSGVTETLIELAQEEKNKNSYIRLASVMSLGIVNNKKISFEQLLKSLEDSEPKIRQVAIWSLEKFKDEDLTDPLINILENDEDLIVRWYAAWGLGEIKNTGSIEALEKAFHKEEDANIKVCSLLSIMDIGGEKADSVIEKIRTERNIDNFYIELINKAIAHKHNSSERIRPSSPRKVWITSPPVLV